MFYRAFKSWIGLKNQMKLTRSIARPTLNFFGPGQAPGNLIPRLNH